MAVGAIAWEAVQLVAHPEPVAGQTVMIVATIGIIINGSTALLFASGRKDDISSADLSLSCDRWQNRTFDRIEVALGHVQFNTQAEGIGMTAEDIVIFPLR